MSQYGTFKRRYLDETRVDYHINRGLRKKFIRTGRPMSEMPDYLKDWHVKLQAVRRRKLETLCEKQDGLCHYCQREMFLPEVGSTTSRKDRATLDHIICQRSGGSDAMDNLVAACQQCNGHRSDLDYDYYVANRLNLTALRDQKKAENYPARELESEARLYSLLFKVMSAWMLIDHPWMASLLLKDEYVRFKVTRVAQARDARAEPDAHEDPAGEHATDGSVQRSVLVVRRPTGGGELSPAARSPYHLQHEFC